MSQSETFGLFVRVAARECFEVMRDSDGGSKSGTKQINKLTPLFSRDAANNYNNVIHKARKPIEELTTRKSLVNPIIVCFALRHFVKCRAQTRKSLEKGSISVTVKEGHGGAQ